MSAESVPQRNRRTPIVLLAGAAIATWIASRMTWVELDIADGLGGAHTKLLDGNQWAAAPTVLAVVLLAAIGAALALNGWSRRILGCLLALVGAGASVPAIVLLLGRSSTDRAARIAELPARAQVTAVHWMQPAGYVAFGAALAVFVAGALLARRPDPNAGLSNRFDRSAEYDDDVYSQRSIWAALDAGTDPTADSANSEAPDVGQSSDGDYSDRNPPEKGRGPR